MHNRGGHEYLMLLQPAEEIAANARSACSPAWKRSNYQLRMQLSSPSVAVACLQINRQSLIRTGKYRPHRQVSTHKKAISGTSVLLARCNSSMSVVLNIARSCALHIFLSRFPSASCSKSREACTIALLSFVVVIDTPFKLCAPRNLTDL